MRVVCFLHMGVQVSVRESICMVTCTQVSNPSTTGSSAPLVGSQASAPSSSNLSLIIGVAVGGAVLLLVVTAIVIVVVCRRRKQRKSDSDNDTQSNAGVELSDVATQDTNYVSMRADPTRTPPRGSKK